ncbi:GNAT family N-acetyltransferase [Streptacidiphilus cavernicola]|uniref:GNAT family N-acetyltransferase n=1 Tax=Streptacidiphilus cavernicola TaxID=3342716 RepID=A0ABV6VUT9_9ACTN
MADNTIGHARAEIHITPSDLGRRVSVRRILEVSQGRPVFGDVVGVLTSWDDGVLTVVDRTGAAVAIRQETLVAGKPVPPAPVRRGRGAVAAHRAVGTVELGRIAARNWPAAETEPLGEWTLRASGGFTKRANSVLVLGGSGLPLDRALERARGWYDQRGLPTYLQVTTGAEDADDALDARLAALGWTAEGSALEQTAPLSPLLDAAPRDGVRLDREPGPAWISRYHRAADPTAAATALGVLRGGPSVWFATVPDPDDPGAAPAAIGRAVVDGRWVCFSAVEVSAGHRRRGLGSAVMAALARAAADEGADLAYLQVESDNAAALAMYRRLGFATHHRYHYRRAPQE